MAITLTKDDVELTIERPTEGYLSSRFDRTGKVLQLTYKGITLASQEKLPSKMDKHCGMGFFNEFGIESPLGFEEAEVDGRFLKIGVGSVLKEEETYDFLKPYWVNPMSFQLFSLDDEVNFRCVSEELHGYAYDLSKTIRVLSTGFEIDYCLKNCGDKPIVTSEYNHNFIGINQRLIGPEYSVHFESAIDQEVFKEYVDNESLIEINSGEISFKGTPKEDFFISRIMGIDGKVFNSWSLKNEFLGLTISEVLEGPSMGVNCWGWGHVISPEIFVAINIEAGETQSWKRVYNVALD